MPTCILGCPWGQGLVAGILPKRSPRKRSPRSAGDFCRDFTEKKSPQCRAYTWALQMEKSISPLFKKSEFSKKKKKKKKKKLQNVLVQL